MFRAQMCQLKNSPTLKLEGRLVGAWAEQAKDLFAKDSVPKGLVVDLTDVSYVDLVGEQILNWFRSVGAEFAAGAAYAGFICERMNLPLKAEVPISD